MPLMEARRKKLEELNITRDEINNIGKALQKEEFRQIFAEYCEEVTNPENRKLYQKEVKELERQRGVDVTFINPEAGFVVKTSIDGERKAFINICKNDVVAKPSSSAATEKGSQGRHWSLPFSLAPPREDYDKSKKPCTVFDVVFHPETLSLAERSGDFRKMLIATALDAVENNCQAKLDRANLKYPKMTYKGLPQAAVIRKAIPDHRTSETDKEFLEQIPYPTDSNTWTTVGKEKNLPETKKEVMSYTTPKYSIKYRHDVDLSEYTLDASSALNATVPKALIITIDLPLLKSTKDVSLDISPKSLNLQCEKPNYKLDLVLPYGVDEDAGNANFDVSKRKLTLELPVKRHSSARIDVGREDSGVESDRSGRGDYDSDEKSPSDQSDGASDSSDHPVQEISSASNDGPSHSNGHDVPDDLLQKDVDYILPNYSLNVFDNTVAVVLHVKNVESESICQSILSEGRGVQLTFSSLGGGMFPQAYGFCMAFPPDVFMQLDSLTVEPWDNNVVVQVSLTYSSAPLSEVLIGTGLHDLEGQDVTNLTAVEQKLADLKEKTDNATSQSPLVVVQSAEETELVLEIEPYCSEEKTVPEPSSEESVSSESNETSLSHKSNSPIADKGRRSTVRQMSECSSDDVNGKKIRGILKKRPSRSLSESHADDYAAFYRSGSLSDESGSNSAMGSVSCIGEGGSETGCETENEGGDRQSKKTVRFNDVVFQQTFRPNSSIFGQRKKNQRKQKNKKKAQERKASESENSEPESETEKARRRMCHSEGEASDIEEKGSTKKKIKFLKDLHCDKSQPQAKKILRRNNSSESDEEGKGEGANISKKILSPAGDSSVHSESTDKPIKLLVSNGDSSEDERDDKTENKNKKKKKRKGKPADFADSCKAVSKEKEHRFKTELILELEN